MLIKQKSLTEENNVSLLDSIEHLSLSESAFDPSMVNVRHNARLQQDLIQLESFLGFAQCYGIEDAGLAIHRVCEANSVPRDNLGFVANEENIIADEEIADTFIQLKEAGFPCHVARISSDSLYYSSLMEALEMDQEYATLDESANLINYLNESIIGGAKDNLQKGYNFAKGKVKGAYGVAKNKVSGIVSVASKKLASVNKAIAVKAAEAKKAPASAKALIIRQIDKLKAMGKKLKAQLFDAKESAKAKAKKTIAKPLNAVKNQASKVKEGISGTMEKLKNKNSKEG